MNNDDKYLRILIAAEALIGECGISALSMNKLAKRAGVASGTLYLYFSSKEDLLQHLRARLREEVAQMLNADFDPQASCFEQYQRFVLNAFACQQLYPTRERVRLQLEAMEYTDEQLAALESSFAILVRWHEKGMAEHKLKTMPREMLFSLAFGYIDVMVQFYAQASSRLTLADQQEALEAAWCSIALEK